MKDVTTSEVYKDRRYVGIKELLGYILFDVSGGFNISDYGERYIYDVLKIDLGWLALQKTINSIWDIANDTFTGAIVDKTRTRWGKFKPYLMMTAVPGTILSVVGWMMPLLFNQDPRNLGKFIMYISLGLIGEGMGTFRGIATTGYLASITPHPVDRTRLIMLTQLLSGFFGEQIPGILMGIFIDLVNHKKVSWTMRGIYVKMGLFTTTVSGTIALYFLLVSRERVQQSVTSPKVADAMKSIVKNKPLLVATISDCLSSLRIDAGKTNYFIDVLGSASYKTIVGIPGTFTSTAGIAAVTWARKRYTTKTLWIVGGSFGDLLMALVFFYGSIGGSGKNGWYRDLWKMMPVFMIQEFIANAFLGVKRIIPTEIYNESLDYCEWQNGYRTEGMTAVAKSFASKILNSIMGAIRPLLMKMMGYDLNAGFGKQNEKTKYLLFMFCTLIPFLTSLISVIPKFLYPLTAEQRERMYEELLERRTRLNRELSDGFFGENENVPDEEIAVQ